MRSMVLAVAAMVLPSIGSAQKPAVLHGVVTNMNGVPLPGAEVTVEKTTLRVVTNDSGVFLFDSVPAGRQRVFARRLGFKPHDKGVKLTEGVATQVDLDLEGIPDLLDSVKVFGRRDNSRMAEFYNRRAIGLGAFITRADIERRNASRASDLLRTITGVRVNQSDAFDRPEIQMGRTPIRLPLKPGGKDRSLAADCHVNYYLDGNWVSPGTFHIDELSPSSIEGIEIYRGPAEIPARFRQRETACGLIVIWTREPPEKSGS